MFKNKSLRGDTLIEVLFAITMFSAVAVGSLSIMNQGSGIAQKALEITLVREEIDAQAEALRFLNSSYVDAYRSGVTDYSGTTAYQWQLIHNNIVSTVSSFGGNTTCPSSASLQIYKSFIINTRKATLVTTASTLVPATTFSQVKYNAANAITSAEGIWIEAIASSDTANARYIDFNIRACWTSATQSAPMTLGTIVRLYEPITAGAVALPPVPAPTPLVPAAPVVTANTVGSTTTYTWGAVSCVAGTTARYRYRYLIDSGFTSGWTATPGLTSTLNTANEGFQYTIQVQAQCYNVVGAASAWSATGTASYIRPVKPPTIATFSIVRNSSTQITMTASSSCSASPNIYMRSRMDAYITPRYWGWRFWWTDTRIGGWYADGNGGVWMWNTFGGYGSPLNVSMSMDPIFPGFPWYMAVDQKCANWVTGRESASTGRVQSPALNSPPY